MTIKKSESNNFNVSSASKISLPLAIGPEKYVFLVESVKTQKSRPSEKWTKKTRAFWHSLSFGRFFRMPLAEKKQMASLRKKCWRMGRKGKWILSGIFWYWFFRVFNVDHFVIKLLIVLFWEQIGQHFLDYPKNTNKCFLTFFATIRFPKTVYFRPNSLISDLYIPNPRITSLIHHSKTTRLLGVTFTQWYPKIQFCISIFRVSSNEDDAKMRRVSFPRLQEWHQTCVDYSLGRLLAFHFCLISEDTVRMRFLNKRKGSGKSIFLGNKSWQKN